MIKNSIVLVPFPFDDLSGKKVRPALCLTEEIGKYNHIIIAFISSSLSEEELASDILVKKGSSKWKGTGLLVDSIIRLHKIVTIPRSLIKRRLGKINSTVENLKQEKMQQLFQ